MSTDSRLPQSAGWSDGQWPVVIAVTVVPVVQTPVNDVIIVIAVRHDLMLAGSMVAATTDWGASRRIRLVQSKDVLVVVVAVNRMEMPVVQVVVMVAMRDAQMAARLTMNMGMTGVGVMTCHYTPPFLLGDCRLRERQSQVAWRWTRLTAVLTLRRMARRQPSRATEVHYHSAARGTITEQPGGGDFLLPYKLTLKRRYGNSLARPAVRRSHPTRQTCVYGDCRVDARARHRRKYRNLQLRQRHPAAALPVLIIRAPDDSAQSSPETRGAARSAHRSAIT